MFRFRTDVIGSVTRPCYIYLKCADRTEICVPYYVHVGKHKFKVPINVFKFKCVFLSRPAVPEKFNQYFSQSLNKDSSGKSYSIHAEDVDFFFDLHGGIEIFEFDENVGAEKTFLSTANAGEGRNRA